MSLNSPYTVTMRGCHLFFQNYNCLGFVYNWPVNELYDIGRFGTVDLKTQNLEFPCIGLSTSSVSFEPWLNDMHGIFYIGEV